MRTILITVGMLIASNIFMTMAWYGHLKHKDKALLTVILVSWLIALPEYILQVPANRYGSDLLTATQLKILQEVITLGVFIAFAWLYLGESPTWRTGVAMLLVIAAVAIVLGDSKPPPAVEPAKEVMPEL